jgi:hypothetical protein
MPSPRDGKAGTLVAPTAPKDALDADVASPGEVEKAKASQRESASGKYGSTPVTPYSPPESSDEEKKKSWIEIKLIDKKGEPVAGEPYTITLGDGRIITGTTGADGSARHNNLDPGSAQVTFPELDNPAVTPL